MATKKKTPAEAPATPAKFPARARKKAAPAAAVEVSPSSSASIPDSSSASIPDSSSVSAPGPAVVEPTQDAIRARAYAIWCAEGGNARENWFRAEAELRGR